VRDFASQTTANFLGTLLAAAVVYLVGVVSGAIDGQTLATYLAIAAFALFLGYQFWAKISAPMGPDTRRKGWD
jgi:hypothetical protein